MATSFKEKHGIFILMFASKETSLWFGIVCSIFLNFSEMMFVPAPPYNMNSVHNNVNHSHSHVNNHNHNSHNHNHNPNNHNHNQSNHNLNHNQLHTHPQPHTNKNKLYGIIGTSFSNKDLAKSTFAFASPPFT